MLELRNVSKYFNKNTPSQTIALNNVTLKIKPREFITVIGGNGAGKSTIMNILSGSMEPDNGMVLLNDYDITFMSEHKRAPYFGRVFQDPMSGTAGDMSILENMTIAYSRGRVHSLFRWFMNKKDKEYFVELLKTLDLGLENRLTEKVGLLSGGQRQALTLLMATMRQRPSERVIKRDYVRFCEEDKEKAKGEVLEGFKAAKEDRKASLARINSNNQLKFDLKCEYKNKRIEINSSDLDKKAKKEEFNNLKAWYKNEIKRISELPPQRLSKEEKDTRIAEIKKEYDAKISKFDLTKQILLLDEHTAALDPKTASKVLELTEKIVKDNQLTTIMVTHNMRDAIKYGSRLIMMSHGKIVVDISGEEKKKLTVEQLLDMFQVASKNDVMSDSAILGD